MLYIYRNIIVFYTILLCFGMQNVVLIKIIKFNSYANFLI